MNKQQLILDPRMNFRKLLDSVQPTVKELVNQRASIDDVKSAIAAHLKRDIEHVYLIGSTQKKTAIRGQADIDALFVLCEGADKWGGKRVSSKTLVKRFKAAILSRYPTTQVRPDGQAVSVRFKNKAVDIDVIPGVLEGKIKNANCYLIPDGRAGWFETVPVAELRNFNDANKHSGGKLKSLIQLLKYWKSCRQSTSPIKSYYLELVSMHQGIAVGPRSYPEMLALTFSELLWRNGRSHRDPKKRVGLTRMMSNGRSPEAALAVIQRCEAWSWSAMEAQSRGNFRKSNQYWSSVFRGQI